MQAGGVHRHLAATDVVVILGAILSVLRLTSRDAWFVRRAIATERWTYFVQGHPYAYGGGGGGDDGGGGGGQ
eukprot:COSAG05_NODE_2048_length_3640_cov_5.415619_4_plen_72_part_00